MAAYLANRHDSDNNFSFNSWQERDFARILRQWTGRGFGCQFITPGYGIPAVWDSLYSAVIAPPSPSPSHTKYHHLLYLFHQTTPILIPNVQTAVSTVYIETLLFYSTSANFPVWRTSENRDSLVLQLRLIAFPPNVTGHL